VTAPKPRPLKPPVKPVPPAGSTAFQHMLERLYADPVGVFLVAEIHRRQAERKAASAERTEGTRRYIDSGEYEGEYGA
jgi:hypothetical protein